MTSGRSRLLATLAGATLIPSLVSGLPTPDYASHQLDKRTPTMTATYFYSDDCTGNVLDTVPYPAGCYAPDYNFAGSMKWTLSGTNGDAQVLTYAQSGCVGDPLYDWGTETGQCVGNLEGRVESFTFVDVRIS